MRRILATLLTLFAAALPVPVPAETQPAASPAPAATGPFATDAAALATLQGYLGRMNVSAELDTSKSYPILSFTSKMENAAHRVRIVIDSKRGMVYIFLNRYLSLPDDSPNRNAVLRELMKKNWDLNIGKYEWDPSDGEIRLSYCFTTENGIGYEAFEAIVRTLLDTGDKFWPNLRKLVAGEKPAGGK